MDWSVYLLQAVTTFPNQTLQVVVGFTSSQRPFGTMGGGGAHVSGEQSSGCPLVMPLTGRRRVLWVFVLRNSSIRLEGVSSGLKDPQPRGAWNPPCEGGWMGMDFIEELALDWFGVELTNRTP